jgi:hypothetical protein
LETLKSKLDQPSHSLNFRLLSAVTYRLLVKVCDNKSMWRVRLIADIFEKSFPTEYWELLKECYPEVLRRTLKRKIGE